jgi:hypothetical protein
MKFLTPKKGGEIMKKILIAALFFSLLSVFAFAGSKNEERAEFEWDANAEPGVGYKIYYGSMSRHDPGLDHEKIYDDVIEKYCANLSEGELLENCQASVTEFCEDPADELCDFDFFTYEKSVDVGSALGWVYKSTKNETLYYTAIAYNEKKTESRFCQEIKIDFDAMPPDVVMNFTGVVKDGVMYRILVESEQKVP